MNALAPAALMRAERLEIVDSAERLAAIGPAWMELWQRADGLVFQSHAWIAAWWSTVPDRASRTLRIGLVWNGDRLDAVMPLSTQHRRGVTFLEWAANSYSDYEDILAAPDCPTASVHRLWAQMCKAGGFDLALINRLQPGAAARLLLDHQGGVKLTPNYRKEISHRVVGDWTSGDAWFDARSKKTRQNHRRSEKALEESGAIAFRLLGPDEDLAPVLERLSALKRLWLESRGHISPLFDEGAPALAAFCDALAHAGILHIFVLELDGVIIAISVNFVQRNTMMAFVTTYDPQYERASPGAVLMTDYIKWSFDHGLGLVDFLCGAEAFKSRFSTTAVQLDAIIGARTPRGHAVLLADTARHAWRQWQANRTKPPAEAEATQD